MNKPHPHNDIIERKLEQLPGANADSLWDDMHLILDKKMPQKKERRRFIAGFLISKPFLLLITGVIIGTGSTLLFLSTKKNSATITRLPDSPQLKRIDENDPSKMSPVNKENLTTTHRPMGSNINKIPMKTNSTRSVEDVINKPFITEQIKKQAEIYAANDQFDEPIQVVITSRPDFNIEPASLKSSEQGLFILSGLNEEKKLPILEPMTSYTKTKTMSGYDRGFYTGIISGIDLSSVNFQSAKTGSTKGFIVGYALNEKWSIESGLFWDTKRVFDNGEHFNPPGYTPSSGITLRTVNGKSRLYELPVNVKYTILPGKQSLFATTGLSSYLMRSENYDYEYWQNNQPAGHNYLSYKNETKNWLAVVNLSLGYAHKLGSAGTLRLEPYLKLPIKNIGVGKMPIMSSGLNIGFTKTVK